MNQPPSRIAGNSADVAEVVAAGLAHHQAGRLAEAEAHYRRILDGIPDYADVLHLLGGLACQLARYGEAIALTDRAIVGNGNDPSYQRTRSLMLQSLNRLDEAVASYDRASLSARILPGYNLWGCRSARKICHRDFGHK